MRTKAPSSSNSTAGSFMTMLATWRRMRPEPSNHEQLQLHFSVLHDDAGHLAADAASAALEAARAPIHPARERGPSHLEELRVVDLAVPVSVGLAEHLAADVTHLGRSAAWRAHPAMGETEAEDGPDVHQAQGKVERISAPPRQACW